MRKCCFLLIVFTLSISAHASEWVKYQSQSFTIYSDQRESQVRELVEDLEAFRIIAMIQLGLPVAKTKI